MLDKEGKIRDLSAHVSDIGGNILSREGLARLAAIETSVLPILTEDRIGACVAGTGKFICIGLNYADHAAESNMPLPIEPIIFMKASSAICGPNDDVIIPRGSEKNRLGS